MPPKDYRRAREETQSNKDEESFCAIIDGAPYFPNLVVPSTPSEDREAYIKQVIELLILQTAPPKSESTSSSLDSSSWKVTTVTGGNTNQLFCVSGMSNSSESFEFEFPNDSVLVRLFGADGMIDRDEETSTYSSLANQELALKYYGRFGNGRIEEMLVGWTTLTEDCLMGRLAASSTIQKGIPPTNLNESIARELARLHATYELPSHFFTNSGSLPEPTLWTQLYPWLERALAAKFLTDHDTHRANHVLDPPLVSLKKELDWLKSSVVGESSTGIGFCHNDLLASNLMMKTKSNGSDNPLVLEGLRFIDFEYGGINYYAYDIANHFNEYAGGTAIEDNSTPDYNRMPSENQQKLFLEAYADEYNTCKSGGSESNKIIAEELGAMVDGFILANHLVWGLWGVLQATTEGCEDGLDYLNYAKCRFDKYRQDKSEKYGNL